MALLKFKIDVFWSIFLVWWFLGGFVFHKFRRFACIWNSLCLLCPLCWFCFLFIFRFFISSTLKIPIYLLLINHVNSAFIWTTSIFKTTMRPPENQCLLLFRVILFTRPPYSPSSFQLRIPNGNDRTELSVSFPLLSLFSPASSSRSLFSHILPLSVFSSSSYHLTLPLPAPSSLFLFPSLLFLLRKFLFLKKQWWPDKKHPQHNLNNLIRGGGGSLPKHRQQDFYAVRNNENIGQNLSLL